MWQAAPAQRCCLFVLAAAKASRTFRILRDGDDIGTHTLDAVSGPNGFEIDIRIRIAVKVLGITAYRYELDNREVWKDGRIVSVDSTVNDDGTSDRSNIKRKGDGLVVDGSRYSGPAPADAVTTSYYARPFIDRRPWISTQSGKPLTLDIAPDGRANWFRTSGELTTTLGYQGGEWTGCEFDAGGEPGVYEMVRQSGKIAALWAEA